MSGKKDDTCSGGSELDHDVDPMRHLGGHGPAGYQSGPTHVDRADFRTGDDAAETSAETPAEPPEAEAEAETEAETEQEP